MGFSDFVNGYPDMCENVQSRTKHFNITPSKWWQWKNVSWIFCSAYVVFQQLVSCNECSQKLGNEANSKRAHIDEDKPKLIIESCNQSILKTFLLWMKRPASNYEINLCDDQCDQKKIAKCL